MLILKKCFAASSIAASLFVVSCQNGQELAHIKGRTQNNTVKSQNPQFLDNVTVGGNANAGQVKVNIPSTVHNVAEQAAMTVNNDPENAVANTKSASTLRYTGVYSEDNFLSSKYAMVLGIMPAAIKNYSLYNFIDEWYGTRYRLGGRDKSGIDCSAFVQRLYEEVFGTPVVRTAMEQFNACKKVFNHSELEEGDLVFFRIHSKRISHVGVYLANNYFVHASSSQGVMISNLSENYWSRFFAGAGKML
jgi:cell wall-associated NlpC family hydrolase